MSTQNIIQAPKRVWSGMHKQSQAAVTGFKSNQQRFDRHFTAQMYCLFIASGLLWLENILLSCSMLKRFWNNKKSTNLQHLPLYFLLFQVKRVTLVYHVSRVFRVWLQHADFHLPSRTLTVSMRFFQTKLFILKVPKVKKALGRPAVGAAEPNRWNQLPSPALLK